MSMDKELIEHMMNPKNYGTLKSATVQGIGKNPDNGEKVAIYLEIKEDEEEPYINDIAFQAIGCSTTVVAGSMITEDVKELHLRGARELIDATMGFLNKLPPEEAACSEMVALALKAALDTYDKRKTEPDYPVMTYIITESCVPKEESN